MKPFVARERELQQLHKSLDKTMKGHSRVNFIIGGPGSGKTVLLEAFSHQAMEKYANLLVANGNCIAYSGIGDPYLPFRDILTMLAGDVETKWDTGAITKEHATRLWKAFPIVATSLLEQAPNSIDILIQGEDLLQRAAFFELTRNAPWVSQLRELIKQPQIREKDFEISHLFQQITSMLRTIAKKKPLLLIIDDLQWMDSASISLLFHLGRRFSETNSKILILCALRPEEVISDHKGNRHPLDKLIYEFKQTFGDEWVELDRFGKRDAQRFIDAFLDTEPNKLSENFRSGLLHRTNGHPLFTIELLKAMQERGDLFKDEQGFWVESVNLNWNLLPTKVEAVIEERVGRLDPKLQEILTIASVVGEIFIVDVLAEVQREDKRSILRYFSLDLERHHRLVREQEGIELNGKYFTRYKFNHILYQNYFYNRICEGERRLLHASIADAIEKLIGNQLDGMTVQLAHHLHLAGDYRRASRYYIQAAERASSIYANNEAITHYSKAIDLISETSLNAVSQANLFRDRGCVYESLGKFDLALRDLETALGFSDKIDDRILKWRILTDLGKLWTSRDYTKTKEYFDSALSLSRSLDQPEIIAQSLNWVGNWHTNADEPQKAFSYHQEALSILKKQENTQELANTLDLLGITNLMGGNLKNCVQYYDQAIPLFRQLDNRRRLVSSLTGRAASYSMLALLASISDTSRSRAISDINEAIHIAGEISLFLEKPWPYWALGLLQTVNGQYGSALKALRSGLQIATEFDKNEFVMGHLFGLGLLYIELFDPDQAIVSLRKYLAMAKDLISHIHINISCGLLAGAYLAQNNIALAQQCLDEFVSNVTPMDTVGKRLCWLRKAEIALAQEKPEVALEIIDRLIDTTPGIEAGDVITYLWMLKGDALHRQGLFDTAISFLKIAATNAEKMEENFLLWRVHACLGQIYLSMHLPEKAQKEILLSQSIVNKIAATIFDPIMKEKFIKGTDKILLCN